MCTVRCIYPGCNYTAEDPKVPSFNGGGYTHGLCPTHWRQRMLETFQMQQRNEGHRACAGDGEYAKICGQMECTYRPVCSNPFPAPADYLDVERRQQLRRIANHGSARGASHRETLVMAAG